MICVFKYLNQNYKCILRLFCCNFLYFIFASLIPLYSQSAQHPVSDEHPAMIRKNEEIEQLRDELESQKEESRRKDILIESLESEKEAMNLQKSLGNRKENLMMEDLVYESALRHAKELELLRLKGNLLYPGAGQIYTGRNRGWIWAGAFTMSLFAAASEFRNASHLGQSMTASRFNPLRFDSVRSDYRESYDRYTFLSFLSAALYIGSAADAAVFSEESLTPVSFFDSGYNQIYQPSMNLMLTIRF
jgi:hypothetical protein